MRASYLISVDPGLQGPGVALWDLSKPPVPLAVTVFNRSTRVDWWERAFHLADELRDWTDAALRREPNLLCPQDIVVCEFPQYQESAGRSMGWRTGDLQRLTFLTGVFAQRMQPAEFYPVEPSGWKGQLPKHVVEMRITDQLGKATCKRLGIKTHAWDAVGIGLWAIEKGIGE